MKQFIILVILYIGIFTACQPSQESPVEAWPYQLHPQGPWGLISTQGEVIIPAGSYANRPTAMVHGLFAVPDSIGYFTLYHRDQPNQPINDRRFSAIGHFFEEVAPAQESPNSSLLLIDRQGNTRFSSDSDSPYPIAFLHNFSEGRALAVTEHGKYGYLDTQGHWVIPPLYHHAYDFHQGWALVGTSNEQGQMGYQFIDREGKLVKSIQQNPVWLDHGFHEGLLLMQQLQKLQFCYLNQAGEVAFYLPQEVTAATAFCHHKAAVQTRQGWGVINREGHFLLPPRFQQIQLTDPKRIWVQKDNKWACYTDQGEALTAFIYDSPEVGMAQTWAVTQIITDATANHQQPQCFWRNRVAKTESATTSQKRETLPFSKKQLGKTQTKSSLNQKETMMTLSDQNWQNVSLKNPFYQEAQKLLSGQLKESDAKRRRMILNYVEHFRTAYTTKDIDFLEQVFSDRALIIVGKVIKSSQQPEGQFLTPHQVIYQVKSKREYLNRLKQVFAANREISLKFSDFKIMRHPTHPAIYGVSLRQGYTSDLYTDDGYLFLLWDFSDETAPKIHVRTWQPSMMNEHTPLPEEAIINIRHFNLK